MDLSPTFEQEELVRSVGRTLQRHHGDALPPVRELDAGALTALAEGGLLDVLAGGGSAVDAVLVIEEIARAGVCAPAAARALVAPLLADDVDGQVIGLAERPAGVLVRFGPAADRVLALDGDVAKLAEPDAVEAEPVASRWGYPLARVTVRGGRGLGEGSGARLARLWRIGLAAESAGLMAGAIEVANAHVKQRHQFGRPIGSYQAVQHQLARAHVRAEGTKWLARFAAWHLTDDETAAAASTYAAESMRIVRGCTHQVCGAIGITDEFGLLHYTTKLAYLHSELGGAGAHARALARARWQSGKPRRPAPGHRGLGVQPPGPAPVEAAGPLS